MPLSEALQQLASGGVGFRDVVITIDDAWQGTGDHMLPALREFGHPATVYVPAESVVNRQPVWRALAAYVVEMARRAGR
jgi:peptidoglycan/xylan/chitin deacetylase (PgdA/CDA1 family)